MQSRVEYKGIFIFQCISNSLLVENILVDQCTFVKLEHLKDILSGFSAKIEGFAAPHTFRNSDLQDLIAQRALFQMLGFSVLDEIDAVRGHDGPLSTVIDAFDCPFG